MLRPANLRGCFPMLQANLPFRDGVHAACHAILNVLPLYLTCSTADMGTECDNPYDTRSVPSRRPLADSA